MKKLIQKLLQILKLKNKNEEELKMVIYDSYYKELIKAGVKIEELPKITMQLTEETIEEFKQKKLIK